jgi:hypothetical protein
MSLTRLVPTEASDLVWHDRGIAAVIGKTVEATRKMIERGQLRSVRRFHGSWVTTRRALLNEILGEEASQAK